MEDTINDHWKDAAVRCLRPAGVIGTGQVHPDHRANDHREVRPKERYCSQPGYRPAGGSARSAASGLAKVVISNGRVNVTKNHPAVDQIP